MDQTPKIQGEKVKKKRTRRRNRSRYNRAKIRRKRKQCEQYGSDFQTSNDFYSKYPPSVNWFCDNNWRMYEWQIRQQTEYWIGRCSALELENCKLRALVKNQGTNVNMNFMQQSSSHTAPQKSSYPNKLGGIKEKSNLDQQINIQMAECLQEPEDVSFEPDKAKEPYQYDLSRTDDGFDKPHGTHRRSVVMTDPEAPQANIATNECNDVRNVADSEESFTFDVDESMMAFFEKSMKHKLELRKQREEERRQSETDKNTKVDMLPLLVDEKRAEEMKLLYGKSGPKIGARETAIKLTFERRLRLKNYKLWPVVPLKF